MAKKTANVSQDDPALQRLARLGYLLDASIRIPGIGYRIGYDALIGLIPGIGDAAGAALSSYIIVEAARLGAPLSTLLRMVLNVAVEAVIGAIPLIGDLFDAAYKANLRNIALLQAHANPGFFRVSSNRRYFITVALVVILILALIFAVMYFAVRASLDLVGVL